MPIPTPALHVYTAATISVHSDDPLTFESVHALLTGQALRQWLGLDAEDCIIAGAIDLRLSADGKQITATRCRTVCCNGHAHIKAPTMLGHFRPMNERELTSYAEARTPQALEDLLFERDDRAQQSA